MSFIQNNLKLYTVSQLCSALKFPRSIYYKALVRVPSNRQRGYKEFGRKGNPYDNACIEAFHSVLKKEEIYLHTYQDAAEARKAIFEYIEGWYNRKRIHSAVGYLTPQQKEEEELKKAA